MIVVDASVLVSVYWGDDIRHRESRTWLASSVASAESLHAPYLLLAEVAGAITRRTSNAQLAYTVVDQIQSALRVTLHPIEEEIGLLAARLAADLRLHGADATYVALAVHLGAPLLTWDQQQLDRAGQRIPARTPAPKPPSSGKDAPQP